MEKIEEQLVEERGRLREEENGSIHQLSHKEDKIPGEFATKKEKDQLRLRKKSRGSDEEDNMNRNERKVQREEDKGRRELVWKKDEEQHRLRKEKKRLEEEEIRWTKREAKWR